MGVHMPYRGAAAGFMAAGVDWEPPAFETSNRSFASRIRFGRLDSASSRVDRERAEHALRAGLPLKASRVAWADDLPQALARVAGKRTVAPFGDRTNTRDERWRIGGPSHAEVRRIERVAAIDTALLRASRHVAASRIA